MIQGVMMVTLGSRRIQGMYQWWHLMSWIPAYPRTSAWAVQLKNWAGSPVRTVSTNAQNFSGRAPSVFRYVQLGLDCRNRVIPVMQVDESIQTTELLDTSSAFKDLTQPQCFTLLFMQKFECMCTWIVEAGYK